MHVQTVVITSGTLSPIDLYPRILDFVPVSIASLQMTLTRECLCPVILTRGADQMPVSTKYEMRKDEHVLRCALWQILVVVACYDCAVRQCQSQSQKEVVCAASAPVLVVACDVVSMCAGAMGGCLRSSSRLLLCIDTPVHSHNRTSQGAMQSCTQELQADGGARQHC